MSKTFYKLTDQNSMTKNNTRWEIGETKTLPSKKNPQLCSGDVLHAYTNLNLALLLNPIHANFSNPRVWEVTGKVCVSDWGKVGGAVGCFCRQCAEILWKGISKELPK